jgi:hypothetical protein
MSPGARKKLSKVLKSRTKELESSGIERTVSKYVIRCFKSGKSISSE